jgi:FkbM family methyltransferase
MDPLVSFSVSKIVPYAVIRGLDRLARVWPENPHVQAACQRYVNRCRAENNDAIEANGELRFMRERLPHCGTVFDVGANVGDWARLALQVNPRARLYCFEPSAFTFAKLTANAFPANVSCHNLGFGPEAGAATLHVFDEGSGMNSIYPRTGLEDGWNIAPPSKTETIRIDTLDAFCAAQAIDRVDFLKMDVEGHELGVLNGAAGLFGRRAIGAVQFEYGGCNIDSRTFMKDFFEFFQVRGYTLHKIYPDRLLPVARYDQRLDNFQHQNWVAMRPAELK